MGLGLRCGSLDEWVIKDYKVLIHGHSDVRDNLSPWTGVFINFGGAQSTHVDAIRIFLFIK